VKQTDHYLHLFINLFGQRSIWKWKLKMTDSVVLLCTCPDERPPPGGLSLKLKLACVRSAAGVQSVLSLGRKGGMAHEVLLLIKSTSARASTSCELHHRTAGYDTPRNRCASDLPPGSGKYLDWIRLKWRPATTAG